MRNSKSLYFRNSDESIQQLWWFFVNKHYTLAQFGQNEPQITGQCLIGLRGQCKLTLHYTLHLCVTGWVIRYSPTAKYAFWKVMIKSSTIAVLSHLRQQHVFKQHSTRLFGVNLNQYKGCQLPFFSWKSGNSTCFVNDSTPLFAMLPGSQNALFNFFFNAAASSNKSILESWKDMI